MLCENASGAPADTGVGRFEGSDQLLGRRVGMPAVGLPHCPGGRALDELGGIAEQSAVTLLGRAQTSERFDRRLANQRIIGQSGRCDLLLNSTGWRVPYVVELLQHFYGVVRQTRDGRRVPARAAPILWKIGTQSENSHLRLAKRRSEIFE